MYLSFYVKHDDVNCIHVHMQLWCVHVHVDLNACFHIVFTPLQESMLLRFQCVDEYDLWQMDDILTHVC